MINALVTWYKAYGTWYYFLGHKATHVAVGATLAVISQYFNHIFIGLAIILGVAIGKEVADEMKSPAPLYYHVLDVIITVLGGVIVYVGYYYLWK